MTALSSPPGHRLVELHWQDEIAVLTLNNPARRNAYSVEMKEEFRRHLLALHDDERCGAIVLTGSGGHFCAGADMGHMSSPTLGAYRRRIENTAYLVRLITMGPKPVVSAVEGYAYGAGMSLALVCDHVVAAAGARFCCAFLRVGLMPDGGLAWTLKQRVGGAKARELILLAEEFDGEAAWRMGVAQTLAPTGEALAHAVRVARGYAATPPGLRALAKQRLTQLPGTLEPALQADLQLAAFSFPQATSRD